VGAPFRLGAGSRRPAALDWHRRDAVRTLAEGKNAEVTTLAQAMMPNPITITPDSRAVDALREMSNRGFRHLPVVESGKIWGVVSRSDFMGMEIDRLDEEDHL
jgi:signal-transduction protein with cAMP-binding, CBS, and nucleotidyltransferase domain